MAESSSTDTGNKLPVPTMSKSTAQLKSNRDARAMEAIQMKDDQLRILTEQNGHLIRSLDAVEDQCNTFNLEKLAVEEENKNLRDKNFELQSRARAAEAAFKKLEAEVAEKDKQVQIMTDQNSELLRLLETEESQSNKLMGQLSEINVAHEGLKGKYSSLLTTAKTHEEMASRAAREGQLRAEELRLLRTECEQLRTQSAEMQRKAAVEVESLQDQLRVRKEKQYHLLEKMQAADEAKRQAEDQNLTMVEKTKLLHSRVVELETQLQVETRSKRAQEEANRNLSVVEENLRKANAELQVKTEKAEQERLRMEAEARDASDQLREMAEKVFQLLERLKLAELGKNNAVESLRKNEQEMIALKKKGARLLKESTEEGKQRVKAELDKKVLIDQIRALKTHNTQLAQRCKEEVKIKLKEHEERKCAEEKVQTLGGRLSFLLNKLQADEEAKIVNKEEMKKLTAQLKTSQEKVQELLHKLNATGESNRIITQALRMKQEELSEIQIRFDAMEKRLTSALEGETGFAADDTMKPQSGEGQLESNYSQEATIDQIRNSMGKGRYALDLRPSQGFVLIKAGRQKHSELLDRLDVNGFLKRSQKSNQFKELVVEKLAHVLGLLSVEEDDRMHVAQEAESRLNQIDFLVRKTAFLQDRLGSEEDAKRQTLLRYVNTLKSSVISLQKEQSRIRELETQIQSSNSEGQVDEVDNNSAQTSPQLAGARIQLTDSGVGDEEVHALAALLRGSHEIDEVVLRDNHITDEGVRALCAVLDGGCPTLRFVDLRGNNITKAGIRIVAEALERATKVRHVYVHAGGKIEALGTGTWKSLECKQSTIETSTTEAKEDVNGVEENMNQPLVTVETVCVVDIRKNTPPKADSELALVDDAPSGQLGGTITQVGHIEDPVGRGTNQASTVKQSGKTSKHRSLGYNNKTATTRDESKPKKQSKKKLKVPDTESKRKQRREEQWKGRKAGLDIPSNNERQRMVRAKQLKEQKEQRELQQERKALQEDQLRQLEVIDPITSQALAATNGGTSDSIQVDVQLPVIARKSSSSSLKKQGDTSSRPTTSTSMK